MQAHITKVVKRDTDKQGNPYMSKQGRPYSRASIQTVEHGQEWLGGFWSQELQEGKEVDIEVSEREYNGKKYKDFKVIREQKGGASLHEIKNFITFKLEPLAMRFEAALDRMEKLNAMKAGEVNNLDPDAIDDAFEKNSPFE